MNYDHYVDPHERYCDVDGTPWLALAGDVDSGACHLHAFRDEAGHARIRAECRSLAVTNEFAINGHENRISYIVGTGHTYRAAVKKGASAAPGLALEVQAVLDEFLRENQWVRRQQEIVRRRDRDGEVFIRFFPDSDGRMRVRFIEPGEIAAPSHRQLDPAAAFGVLTEPDDVETVRGYFVGGRLVEADEIQHRKANVDANVKRGLPLFFPVRKNLGRAERLLRNMSLVAEVQSAIAMIRKHTSGTSAGVRQFVSAGATLAAPIR